MNITVSMKDALRQRPGLPEGPSEGKQAVRRAMDSISHLPKNVLTLDGPRVICTPMWEPAEYRAFERLTVMVCAPSMPERMRATGWMRTFIEKHGKEKCDMMLAEIRRRDAAEWFKGRKS